jgi:hypothetical protein
MIRDLASPLAPTFGTASTSATGGPGKRRRQRRRTIRRNKGFGVKSRCGGGGSKTIKCRGKYKRR